MPTAVVVSDGKLLFPGAVETDITGGPNATPRRYPIGPCCAWEMMVEPNNYRHAPSSGIFEILARALSQPVRRHIYRAATAGR